jgi:ribonuclease HII
MGALNIAASAALAALELKSSVAVILDGNRDYLSPTGSDIVVQTVIKGDQLCASVAAASILAKQARDAFMVTQAQTYPEYGFERHVGYLTAQHAQALSAHGPTPLHRYTFAGVLP